MTHRQPPVPQLKTLFYPNYFAAQFGRLVSSKHQRQGLAAYARCGSPVPRVGSCKAAL